MFSSFTSSALLTYLQSNHIYFPLIHSSHLVVAFCSVCCLILWSCLTLKGPFEDMHSHIMLGALVSLFFYVINLFLPPSLQSLFALSLFFCTFFISCDVYCSLRSLQLCFFPLISILLLAPYYFAIAHVLMVLTTRALCFTLSWCSTWSFASIGICCLSFI